MTKYFYFLFHFTASYFSKFPSCVSRQRNLCCDKSDSAKKTKRAIDFLSIKTRKFDLKKFLTQNFKKNTE